MEEFLKTVSQANWYQIDWWLLWKGLAFSIVVNIVALPVLWVLRALLTWRVPESTHTVPGLEAPIEVPAGLVIVHYQLPDPSPDGDTPKIA